MKKSVLLTKPSLQISFAKGRIKQGSVGTLQILQFISKNKLRLGCAKLRPVYTSYPLVFG